MAPISPMPALTDGFCSIQGSRIAFTTTASWADFSTKTSPPETASIVNAPFDPFEIEASATAGVTFVRTMSPTLSSFSLSGIKMLTGMSEESAGRSILVTPFVF